MTRAGAGEIRAAGRMRADKLVVSAALAGALLAAASSAEPVGRTACLADVSPFRRASDATYLLALARPDTVVAGHGTVAPTGERGHWGAPRADTTVFGQVFRVERYGGAGGAMIDSVLEPGVALEVVVVLWDYDASCRPTYWSGSSQWVFPDSIIFLSAKMRPSTEWREGRPTFDSFWGGELAYPFDALTQSVEFYRHLDTVGLPYRRRDGALTARDVFTLVDELPAPCDWRARPLDAAARLALVKERRAALLLKHPGRAIAAEHERWAKDPAKAPGACVTDAEG